MGFLKPKRVIPPPPPKPPAVPSQTATPEQKKKKKEQTAQQFVNQTMLTGAAGLMDDPNIVYKKTLGGE